MLTSNAALLLWINPDQVRIFFLSRLSKSRYSFFLGCTIYNAINYLDRNKSLIKPRNWVYIALWIMNLFPPYNSFPREEAPQATRYSLTIYMASDRMRYIPCFHLTICSWDQPCRLLKDESSLFPVYSISKNYFHADSFFLRTFHRHGYNMGASNTEI